MALLEDRMLNGTSGNVTVEIDGRIVTIAEIVKINADIEKTTTEYKVMGNKATQVKDNGWKGSGTMTIRYGSNTFREIMLDYVQTGKSKYFTITIINDDPNFSGGEIRTRLGGVNISKATVGLLDVDTDILDEEVPFTFTEVEDL